uniref:Epidermal growth factor receptor pathway substrate 15 n=1 Tax=Dicentrarchus labrax TaxID=13489 RepID=A0A8C4IQI4_DICLA
AFCNVFFLSQQLSSGNPIYDKYYRQVDPTGSGRVAAADAALFLKRSGLADLVLGKIWDLADSERKGSLNKQQFFIALRLVACAQNGLEVALKSLNVAVPPPKFHDTSSPLLAGGVAVDIPWVVKEKLKFDSIFDSLGPVGGILTGDKVKPVLLNSKLPVDILGRVWELSDIDRDGMLDRDEFSVAMYLVYRALEGEPVPMSLPPPLVPPSKRKKPSWVVSPADKAKYDELFSKTDGDMDGLVSGPEVRDIFLKTGLPSATLARIWELCDIGDIGKLTREQFALALHLINQKLTKGLDPPQSLSSEMIPPSDRQNIKQVRHSDPDFSAIKELDSLSNEIVELQREKSSVEDEIKEKEEAIRQRSNEVQDLQDEVARESEELQRLQAQRQKVQDALEELDQQKGSLEEQLTHIRQQTNQETQLVGFSFHCILIYLNIEKFNMCFFDTFRMNNVSYQLYQRLTKLFILIDDPFKDDLFGKTDVADPFGGDPFKGSDPFAADSFFVQTSSAPFSSDDPFSASADPFGTTTATNDPFAPGGTTVNASSDPDPFAAVFGNESFGGGFADFSALTKSNGADQFGINNKNLFQEDGQSAGPDVPPALPPKTGTPTRPPPPPPGQYLLYSQYPTEEDMIEWAKRESEREEKERLARLTQQEQEDLELAIALSKSELS